MEIVDAKVECMQFWMKRYVMLFCQYLKADNPCLSVIIIIYKIIFLNEYKLPRWHGVDFNQWFSGNQYPSRSLSRDRASDGTASAELFLALILNLPVSDALENEELVHDIVHEIGIRHPLIYDVFNLCEYYERSSVYYLFQRKDAQLNMRAFWDKL